MSIFKDKTLMITGGTGSFGNAVLNRFLRTDIGEIRIFSRDEKKQDDMRHEYQVKYPDVAHKIKFFIGDIRNLQSCRNAMPGVDYIFHAAALKQVPSCEFFPMEAVKAEDMGDFYRVPADNRTLNYDKYFSEGDENRVTLTEFNSENTKRLNLEETKAKIASLEYIQNELKGLDNIAK